MHRSDVARQFHGVALSFLRAYCKRWMAGTSPAMTK
jgi:hypothetical protein